MNVPKNEAPVAHSRVIQKVDKIRLTEIFKVKGEQKHT
jgi:hypothetical protein